MLGVIVLAHGSRDPLWREAVQSLAEQITHQAAHAAVACAYLEWCEPDLPTAARGIVAQGARHVRVLPLFFGMGKHARQDLPRLMAELAQAHPHVRFEQLPAAGQMPRLIDLLARAALEGLT